jgi:Ca-activated chloride channel family protein
MSQTNPREELQDRLTDLALEEILGGRGPSDVQLPVTPKEAAMPRTSRSWLWKTLTLAATLLIAICLAYETGRVKGSRKLSDASNQNSSPYHIYDDVKYFPSGNEFILENEKDFQRESKNSLGQRGDRAGSGEQGGGQGSGKGSGNALSSAGEAKPGDGKGDGLSQSDPARPASANPKPGRPNLPPGTGTDSTPYYRSESKAGEGFPHPLPAAPPAPEPGMPAKSPPPGDPFAKGVVTFSDGSVSSLTLEDTRIVARLKAMKKEDAGIVDADDLAAGTKVEGEMLRKAFLDVTGKIPEAAELAKFKEKLESIEGRGPGQGGDRYREIIENRFLTVLNNPLSTFSIDVDTASYAKVRRLLLQGAQLPPPDAVRIEEFINYFHYNYPGPKDADGKPFAVHTDVAPCPWNAKHKLLRVGIKGKEIENKDRPNSNLVFLVDVSGSMDEPDKLPLVKRGLATLVERLRENDRVAIVVYAGAAGLVLDSTPGSEKKKILDVLDALQPGGSTAGAQGIHLAYEIAQKNFIKKGTNRVILSTDGDFNVGTTSDAELVRLVEEKAKSGVFLTTLGFGIGNHNDSMLEQIADKGNGNCAYIDSDLESRKVFVEQMSATLVTIAKDVKIQVEFNPGKVAAYRLIGYENRMLRTEDFKDDTKDAGEIGAGHTVTALYELVPTGEPVPADTTSLKYQKPSELTPAAKTPELATVFLRYKEPDGDKSKPLEFALKETDTSVGAAAADFKFAAAVASFGMLLRQSQYKGDATFDTVLKLASGASDDEHGYRKEFIEIVKAAKAASGK